MQTPKPAFVMALLAFAIIVAADDLTVVTTLLPQMLLDLEIAVQSELDRAVWIVTGYLIAYTVTMPISGRLSDRYGRRPIFLGCLVLFGCGSLAVPFAPSLPWLIAARVLQAMGGGAMVPVALAIAGDLYPPEQRGPAYGFLSAIDASGWVIGPLYGALLVYFLDWRWQFYLNVPATLVAMGLAWLGLRHLPTPVHRARMDWPGAILLTGGLVGLNLLITRATQSSALLPGDVMGTPPLAAQVPLPLLLGTTALLPVFWWWQRRQPAPLIPGSLLSRRPFFMSGAVNLLGGMALMVTMVDVPLFVNTIRAESIQAGAVGSGVVLAALTGAMVLAALVGGRLTLWLGERATILAGLLLSAIGLCLMGVQWDLSTTYATMAGHLAVAGVGFGLVSAPTATAAINAADAADRGLASGLVVILRLMGMALGLSGLSAYGLNRFQALSAALPPIPTDGSVDYAATLIAQAQQLVLLVIGETFLLAALACVVALVPAFFLAVPSFHTRLQE